MAGRPRVFKDLTPLSIQIESAELTNLKKEGVVINKFFRQAVKAYNEGKWKYNPMEE